MHGFDAGSYGSQHGYSMVMQVVYSMKEKVLRVLTQTDGYVSGQSLCNELNVSRTAVWKCINQLKKEGYIIEAVTNKGYCLRESPDVINEESVKCKLDTKFFGKNIVFFEETDSTNNVIKRLAEDGAEHGTLAIAEIQTAGRGRRGKNWSSPKGSGIWMSFLLKPQLTPQKASMLTLVTAMAAREAVYRETGVETVIKWPNDIVVNGKKVCGILTEMSAELDWIHYVVVGIGINVNTESFPAEIKDVASSLWLETGKKVNRSRVIAAFGEAFERYYEQFIRMQDLSLLKEEYNSHLANLNNKVQIIDTAGEYTGISNGINELGELLVTDDEGRVHAVRSGEVSVRGIYGYV